VVFVNRVIAESLLKKCLPKNLTTQFRTGLGLYRRWLRNEISLAEISEQNKEFIRQFDGLCHEIEDTKLALSRSIVEWKLDSLVTVSMPVAIPENPFVPAAPMVNCQLSATEFRVQSGVTGHLLHPLFVRVLGDTAR
jgi:hypothetical protein